MSASFSSRRQAVGMSNAQAAAIGQRVKWLYRTSLTGRHLQKTQNFCRNARGKCGIGWLEHCDRGD